MSTGTPTPKSILRGHKAQVHAARFLRGNERLATGDADGFVVLWDLTIMRPRAVWRAHENAILGIGGWEPDRIITHGRDHKLIVWRITEDDEQRLSTALPLEDVPTPRPNPWIIHILEVNTMNFCSFASCPKASERSPPIGEVSELLVAVPNTLASEAVDIYQLPSQSRLHTVRTSQKGGMAMSLALFLHESVLTLIAAFEDGSVSVHRQQDDDTWVMTYRSQPHSQPILSLDVHSSHEYFFTSAADSIIAKHPIPTARQEVPVAFDPRHRIIEEIDASPKPNSSLLSAGLQGEAAPQTGPSNTTFRAWEHPLKTVNTKHSGQQSLRIRSDGKIFTTAGWDSNIRVYSTKTLKELAVLQWHKVGCYAIAMADVAVADGSPASSVAHASSTTSLTSLVVSSKDTSVRDRRIIQAKKTHWIAAGAKDGKVSLWDIY